MFRLSVQRQKADLAPNETFRQQDKEIQQMLSQSSEISTASNELYLGKNTIFPNRYEHPLQTLVTISK